MAIPPWAEHRLHIDFHPGAAGPFEKRFPLYTDVPGMVEFPLTIKGSVRTTAATGS